MARDAFPAAPAPTPHVFRTALESSKNLGFFDGGRANRVRRNGNKKIRQWLVHGLHVRAPRPSNLRWFRSAATTVVPSVGGTAQDDPLDGLGQTWSRHSRPPLAAAWRPQYPLWLSFSGTGGPVC